MRLFVALTPPQAVLDDLGALVARIRPDHPELRWTRPEQWHLTLVFLGAVAEDVLPGLRRRLARVAARTPPVTMRFAGGGSFGSPARARVLWVGVRGDREALRRLAGRVAAVATRSGLDVDERPYRPHLTLARAGTPADVRPLREVLDGYAGESWDARHLDLIASHLGPRPWYETVGRWSLAGR